jgi:hypothetical protein
MGDAAQIYGPAAPSSYLTCSVRERWCLAPGDSSGEKQIHSGGLGGGKSHTFSPTRTSRTGKEFLHAQTVNRADVQSSPFTDGETEAPFLQLFPLIQGHWLNDGFVSGTLLDCVLAET